MKGRTKGDDFMDLIYHCVWIYKHITGYIIVFSLKPYIPKAEIVIVSSSWLSIIKRSYNIIIVS